MSNLNRAKLIVYDIRLLWKEVQAIIVGDGSNCVQVVLVSIVQVIRGGPQTSTNTNSRGVE